MDQLKSLGYPDEVATILTPTEVQALTVNNLDFNKIIAFIVGLLNLINQVFGSPPTPQGATPNPEFAKMKACGVPDVAAGMGWSKLVSLIKIILTMLENSGVLNQPQSLSPKHTSGR